MLLTNTESDERKQRVEEGCLISEIKQNALHLNEPNIEANNHLRIVIDDHQKVKINRIQCFWVMFDDNHIQEPHITQTKQKRWRCLTLV